MPCLSMLSMSSGLSSGLPAWKVEMRSLSRNERAEDEEKLLSNEGLNPVHPGNRRAKILVWGKLLLLAMTAGISCLVGIVIGKQILDLNEACALHVSNYCE